MATNYRLCQANPFSEHIFRSCPGSGLSHPLSACPFCSFGPICLAKVAEAWFCSLDSFRWMFSTWDFDTLCKALGVSLPASPLLGWKTGSFHLTVSLLPCSCPGCSGFSDHPLSLGFPWHWARLSVFISAWWPTVGSLPSLTVSPQLEKWGFWVMVVLGREVQALWSLPFKKGPQQVIWLTKLPLTLILLAISFWLPLFLSGQSLSPFLWRLKLRNYVSLSGPWR